MNATSIRTEPGYCSTGSAEDRKTVLIVDDEPDLLDVLAAHVERMGFAVLTAGSSQEAVEIVTEDNPDIVVMDVSMPDVDGIETLHKIRQTQSAPNVVMITGVDDARVFDAVRAGAQGFLLKPFQIRDLENTLNACTTKPTPQGRVS